jgi:hypothetical protein
MYEKRRFTSRAGLSDWVAGLARELAAVRRAVFPALHRYWNHHHWDSGWDDAVSAEADPPEASADRTPEP